MNMFMEENINDIKNTLNSLANNVSESIYKKTENIDNIPNVEHIVYENLIEPFKAIIKKFSKKVDDNIYTSSDQTEIKVIFENLVECFNNSIINAIGESVKSEKKINEIIDRVNHVSSMYINDLLNVFTKYIENPSNIEYINYNCDFKGINSFLSSVADAKIVKKGKNHIYVDSNKKEYKMISKQVNENNLKCIYKNDNDQIIVDVDMIKTNDGKPIKFTNKFVHKNKIVLAIGIPSSFVINMIDKETNDYIYVFKSTINGKFVIDVRNVSFTSEKYKELDENEHQEYALDILKKRFKYIYKTLMNDVDFNILVDDISSYKKLDEKDKIISDLRKQLKQKNKTIKELQEKLKKGKK